MKNTSYTDIKKIFGYTPDFKNPQTFNEKIIHRILFDRNPIYTALADKLKARIILPPHYNTLIQLTTHKIILFTILLILRGGGGQPYSLNQNNTDLQNNPTLNTTTSTIPQTQHATDSQLSQKLDSLLFQPIDTLTQELFNTNECQYLPKLYGIYKSVDEIDFSKLPQSFVLKTNHDCGGVVLVKDKESFLKDSKSFNEAMTKLTTHLNTNFYTLYREWHYKDIEPRIFAEEMLDCGKNGDDKRWEAPLDYKIHIMHDKIGYIEVAADSVRHHKELIVDTQYNEMPFDLGNRLDFLPEKPKDFDIMLDMARKLAYFTDYVRVDLYYVNNKIYVGELTFTNAGGADTFNPNEWDKKLGELWQPNPCKQYEACANNLLSCSKSL
ncbi:ATP-grasp fold amidoligase family protein [Helicobacter bilis]|uniref:ATP-grasp fold amidoligase family protein n=3 Tax=Helicobacter bilis TaxID=37372 RepID=UPI001F222892|nr:ATP-grasp fold amidoligase family protein [Helicobacter bilis]